MKPICVTCRRFYRPKKNGVFFEEGMPRGTDAFTDAPLWGPYKLWVGDLWECQSCGAEIIVGFGLAPVAEHYQPDYADKVSRHKPLLRVDD